MYKIMIFLNLLLLGSFFFGAIGGPKGFFEYGLISLILVIVPWFFGLFILTRKHEPYATVLYEIEWLGAIGFFIFALFLNIYAWFDFTPQDLWRSLKPLIPAQAGIRQINLDGRSPASFPDWTAAFAGLSGWRGASG